MTIAEARSLLQQFARNADDYTATEFDRAILATGNDFVNRTRCTLDFSSIPTVANQSSLDTGWAGGFRADRLLRIWYGSDRQLRIIPAPDVLAMGEESESSGIPGFIGFFVSSSISTQAVLYPTPAAVYVLDYIWTPPFTAYTPGTGTTSTTLNIPDDLIYDAIIYGAVARLQMTMPEHQSYVRECRRLYEDHVIRSKGMISLEGRTSPRYRLR